ncbi:hypothetical protein DN402_16435 [Streptomyces sp. SW4]|nr:hypothetical protein DN402_16435 [Streptomyces sp. SW4]
MEAVPADAEDPSTWSAWRRLLPHVEALAGHTDPQADTVSLARVFGRAGEFAAGQGLRGRAGQLVERSESAIVRHLGPEHPLALVARNRVIAMDPLPEAEMREHITRCERVLGPRHPETITAWFESAASHMRAGDFEGVERVVEHVVKMRRRVLGPGHAHTLRARWTLLLAKSMQAGLDGLAPEIELLMADCVRDLGERHPLTLDVRLMWHSRNKIGTDLIKPLYSAVRASEEEREDILREALERTRQKVDPEAMREWAREALPEAERHVADCEEALGPEHSDTVWARLNLVQAYLVAEDFDNALRHARQAAADAEQQRRSGADAAPSVMAHLLMMFTSAVARDESAVTDAIGWFRSASEQFGDDSGGPLGPDVIEQMERFMAALMNREGAGETNREGAGETNREGAGEMNREGAEEGTS